MIRERTVPLRHVSTNPLTITCDVICPVVLGESLVESCDPALENLHPGGLVITRELAELCHVTNSARVLDVASGTGKSACYLCHGPTFTFTEWSHLAPSG